MRPSREIDGKQKLITLDKKLVIKAEKLHLNLSSFFNEELKKYLKNK